MSRAEGGKSMSVQGAIDWLDTRLGWTRPLTGYTIPGGPRWRFSTGSVLVYLFAVELITGLFLMLAYAPSARTAWESVFYIEPVMAAGSVVRGIHHYATHAMVVAMGLHLASCLVDVSYRAPREAAWWTTLALAGVLVLFSQTGYLLPWDQRGRVATGIATKIAAATPGVGPSLGEVARGGGELGNATITRFYALHVGVLPILFIGLGWLRLKLQRVHGYAGTNNRPAKSRQPAEPHGDFERVHWWPDQAVRDAVAAAITLAIVIGLAVWHAAPLGPPADATIAFDAARPEWWFLPVFRLLHMEGVTELIAGHLVPAVLFFTLAALPFLPRSINPRLFGLVFFGIAAIGGALLGGASLYEDFVSEEEHGRQFRASVAESNRDADRAVALSVQGIPPDGAAAMLRRDPLLAGGRLFAMYCSSCHGYDGHDGNGHPLAGPMSAPDLARFGQREWVRTNLVAFRDQFAPLENAQGDWAEPAAEILDGDMAYWCDENGPLLEAAPEDLAALVEYVVSQSGRDDLGEFDAGLVDRGRQVLQGEELSTGESVSSCIDCHALTERQTGEELLAAEDGYAPPLTGYGGQGWIRKMLIDPVAHYGEPNAMPAFGTQLSETQIDLLAKFLTRDYPLPDRAHTTLAND